MKAVLLVGGEATRLRPLTCNTTKAMVPLINVPFLEYVIRYLAVHGIDHIILTQRSLSTPLADYFGDGRRLGVRLIYTIEETPLDTAGAVKNAARDIDDTFVVMNGDVFTNLDITALVAFHKEKQSKTTIALTPVENPTIYGLIETDAVGSITRFLEKPSWSEVTTNMINAGIYVMEPEVLSLIPPNTRYSFERGLFPMLLAKGSPFCALPSNAYWMDIGTPEKYFRANCDLLEGRCRIEQSEPPAEGACVGEGTTIHPSTRIEGRVVIGDNCNIEANVRLIGPTVIGANCRIQAGAVIEASILWHGVEVGEGAQIRKSVVANNCGLHSHSIVEECFLGDSVTLATSCKLEPGSKIWPGTRVDASSSGG
ncbi:MAG: NDP-sugar synthase [Chloroflexi bacterium]|nr:NDP-sugar synthase [Chloroflexota bacterium]